MNYFLWARQKVLRYFLWNLKILFFCEGRYVILHRVGSLKGENLQIINLRKGKILFTL